MTPRRCTYGAFEGEIRLEGRCLVFVARGGRREELGVVRDGFLHLDRLAEPHGTEAGAANQADASERSNQEPVPVLPSEAGAANQADASERSKR